MNTLKNAVDGHKVVHVGSGRGDFATVRERGREMLPLAHLEYGPSTEHSNTTSDALVLEGSIREVF